MGCFNSLRELELFLQDNLNLLPQPTYSHIRFNSLRELELFLPPKTSPTTPAICFVSFNSLRELELFLQIQPSLRKPQQLLVFQFPTGIRVISTHNSIYQQC